MAKGKAKTLNTVAAGPSLAALREQLEAAAKTFVGDSAHLGELMRAMVDDVQRAAAEPLEIFPVKHHSPASALHMLRRLRERPPKVIFMEGCEDLGAALQGLENCRFPIALQAYAPESPAFPSEWTPLNLVAPLTQFSAEYQALAFSHGSETPLVFVDRSVDHVFQWMPREGPPPGVENAEGDEGADDDDDDDSDDSDKSSGDTANLHGGAVGLQIGAMEPTFNEFVEVLLRNARVRHYSEWWSQYVEAPTLAADYDTYRHVFFLVGSLLRRIGITDQDREKDAARERYMWAKMRSYLRTHNIAPEDAIYVCGAIHAVSPIAECGVHAATEWTITPRTDTAWFYGLVPSSYAAIEHQFSLPAGEIALAKATWEKGLSTLGLKPFKIPSPAAAAKKTKKAAKKKSPTTSPRKIVTTPAMAAAKSFAKAKATASTKPTKPTKPTATAGAASAESAQPATISAALGDFLSRPPAFVAADDEQLMRWCVDIVRLARKNGYMASTADTIAIHHTANLLANLRDRPHPTAYDFQDAAITCLEKDRTPRRRTIRRCCQILLGGDRLGRVGYESLPPLAQDVYDRLAILGVDLKSNRIQRALLDIHNNPDLLPASDLLWRLRYLGLDVRPIMGERSLGHKPKQESWDIAVGKHQSSLIQLGYEGMTVEQVLERKLKKSAYKTTARAASALKSAEDSVLYLRSGRLTRELGLRATDLLKNEVGAADAPEIFQRVRALVHYYRTIGLPQWIKDFVSTGYRNYTTLLPFAFADRGCAPKQLSSMLAFIFTQESLALSMGCERSQLLIALGQAEPEDPAKISLLWAAEWIVGLRTEDSIREEFLHLMGNDLLLPAFPEYMAGFLLALEFTPRISRLAVELLSRAFALLPDEVLVPWLPTLVVTLRPLGTQLMQTLVREAGLAFPRGLDELPVWEAPWERQLPDLKVTDEAAPDAATGPSSQLSPTESALADLMREQPASLDALAIRLGLDAAWAAPETTAGPQPRAGSGGAPSALARLLAEHPATLDALVRRIGDAS